MNDKKISVLVIDDDEVDRIALKRSIKSSGFNVEIITATNKMEALVEMGKKYLTASFWITIYRTVMVLNF
ncbi:MAG: hypothetical protein IPP71_00195 [Bacteroidetes bacterium]|nr:hypothetical protein [Bacteroidota bacterium]